MTDKRGNCIIWLVSQIQTSYNRILDANFLIRTEPQKVEICQMSTKATTAARRRRVMTSGNNSLATLSPVATCGRKSTIHRITKPPVKYYHRRLCFAQQQIIELLLQVFTWIRLWLKRHELYTYFRYRFLNFITDPAVVREIQCLKLSIIKHRTV